MVVFDRLVIASSNEGKIKEFSALFSPFAMRVERLPQGFAMPEETGGTFAENALQKARFINDRTGLPALADDSGLCVDALNGAPGVFSGRFAGPDATDADNRALLLERLMGVSQAMRGAELVAALALVTPDGRVHAVEGRVRGEILLLERGTGGFGYDSIFYYPPLARTFAELAPEEKNHVSHRTRAMQALAKRLISADPSFERFMDAAD